MSLVTGSDKWNSGTAVRLGCQPLENTQKPPQPAMEPFCSSRPSIQLSIPIVSMETSFLFQCSSLAIPSTLGSANPPSVSTPEITILHKLFNGGGSCRPLSERPESLSFSQEDSPNMSRWFALGVLPWHHWKLSFTLTSQLGQFRNSHGRECLSSPEKPHWEHCTCTRSRW